LTFDRRDGGPSPDARPGESPQASPRFETPLRPPDAGRGRLLVVDDDEQIRKLLVRLLTVTGHVVEEAGSAEEALVKIEANPPDLILLDMELPGKSGLALAPLIRADPRHHLTPIIMMTGAATPARKIRALDAGVTEFLSKPFSHAELAARVRALLAFKHATDALEDAEQVILALAQTIDARDPYTYSHSARVSLYAGLLGERVGLEPWPLAIVRRGGLFHDFGKISIRDRVLLKPGRLTEEEYAEIKRHPRTGRNLLANMKTLAPALDIVEHHHERMDGSGYPDGMSGESIPITARITSVADVFDALTTARVYRAALSREEAFDIMSTEVRKGWWDGRLLGELRGLMEELPETDERLVRLGGPPQIPDSP
jgi:putative two-component system response regulator